MTDRLAIDMDRCHGHGICLLQAPGLIRLDRWGYPVVADRPLVERADQRRARRALRACPRTSLRLETVAEAPP